MSQAPTGSEAGFSLLEVLIALIILSLMGAASTYAVSMWQQRTELLAATTHFDEAVSSAATEAIRTGLPHSIRFRAGAFEADGADDAHLYRLSAAVKYAVESALELRQENDPVIVFFADGTNSGGTVTFSIGNQSESRTIGWMGAIDDGPR